LAKLLGCSYWTLIRKYWSYPDRPKDHSPGKAKYDILAYRLFINRHRSAHNFGSRNSDVPQNGVSQRELALIEKSQVATERERFKLGIERREYIKRDEVNERLTTDYAIIRRELYKAFEHDLPPRIEGLSAMDIRKANRKRLDEIFRSMPRMFDNGNGSAAS